MIDSDRYRSRYAVKASAYSRLRLTPRNRASCSASVWRASGSDTAVFTPKSITQLYPSRKPGQTGRSARVRSRLSRTWLAIAEPVDEGVRHGRAAMGQGANPWLAARVFGDCRCWPAKASRASSERTCPAERFSRRARSRTTRDVFVQVQCGAHAGDATASSGCRYDTSGLRVPTFGKRLKSRSAVHSSATPWWAQSAATRASCPRGPEIVGLQSRSADRRRAARPGSRPWSSYVSPPHGTRISGACRAIGLNRSERARSAGAPPDVGDPCHAPNSVGAA